MLDADEGNCPHADGERDGSDGRARLDVRAKGGSLIKSLPFAKFLGNMDESH